MFVNLFLIIQLCFYNVVLCSYYKNDSASPSSNSAFHEETLKNLEHIQLRNKIIPKITKDLFYNLNSVEKLEIESCQVRSIEERVFDELRTLRRLSLKHNLLEEIKSNIFNGLLLEELDLSDNRIKEIEENAFDNMPQLKTIKLSNNRIEIYRNKWFLHCPKLVNLDFSNNFINSLPSRILGGDRDENVIVNLYFNHNDIKEVDDRAFEGISHIWRLYLIDNVITEIKKDIFSGIRIEDLKLDFDLCWRFSSTYLKNRGNLFEICKLRKGGYRHQQAV